MKPRIFIGSSTEGLKVAEEVKSFFKENFECFMWTDEIFKYNENFLETLLKEASLFDYGLMVFTKDDYTKSRDQKFDSPRDNVVFEYGLFLGRLGKDNAFVIVEEDVKLPTDLLGTSTVTFKWEKKKKLFSCKHEFILDKQIFHTKLKTLERQIEAKVNLGVLGMLPSTPLAIGYFENFVQPVCEHLASNRSIEIGGETYDQFKFRIILPKDLDSDIKKRANTFYRREEFEVFTIPTPGRPFPLFVMFDANNNLIILSDMPTTLSSIDKAIEMYLRKGHIGKSNEQQLLEDRELRNFNIVLDNLIKNDAYCKDVVSIEIES